jgi:hypothetical protein
MIILAVLIALALAIAVTLAVTLTAAAEIRRTHRRYDRRTVARYRHQLHRPRTAPTTDTRDRYHLAG